MYKREYLGILCVVLYCMILRRIVLAPFGRQAKMERIGRTACGFQWQTEQLRAYGAGIGICIAVNCTSYSSSTIAFWIRAERRMQQKQVGALKKTVRVLSRCVWSCLVLSCIVLYCFVLHLLVPVHGVVIPSCLWDWDHTRSFDALGLPKWAIACTIHCLSSVGLLARLLFLVYRARFTPPPLPPPPPSTTVVYLVTGSYPCRYCRILPRSFITGFVYLSFCYMIISLFF